MTDKVDYEIYKCKAVCLEDDETVVCGYYYRNECNFIDDENMGYEERLEFPTTTHEINYYTLCRNTGIKLPNGSYFYEYDLVEYTDGFNRSPKMGYIEWDDWSMAYRIRTSANYSSKVDIRAKDINVIGNVILYKDDMPRFQKYSDKVEENPTHDIRVECRSTQALNKKAKMFLPR
ncbi:YopX family protein [Desulfosporosinus fructosivorans]